MEKRGPLCNPFVDAPSRLALVALPRFLPSHALQLSANDEHRGTRSFILEHNMSLTHHIASKPGKGVLGFVGSGSHCKVKKKGFVCC